jgi:hypothetical protein
LKKILLLFVGSYHHQKVRKRKRKKRERENDEERWTKCGRGATFKKRR